MSKARRTVHSFVAGSLVATAALTLPATSAQATDSVEPSTRETPAAAADSRRRAPVDGDHAPGLETRGTDHVPGEVVVRFAPGVRGESRAAARSAAGAKLERRLPRRLELLKVRGGVGNAVKALERRPEVLYAEPNYVYTLSALPDDPKMPELWGLNDTGQPVYDQPGDHLDADIDAPLAWDKETGDAAVTVAIVDSGVDMDHPDLAGNIWTNTAETANGMDDDGNGYVDDVRGWDWIDGDNDPDDPNGHGTHVAGTAGAVGDNGVGVAGVAWDVSLMPLRVADAAGRITSADIAEAFLYAAAQGAGVVNASLGDTQYSQALADAVDAAPDTLFVTSAGNSSSDNDGTPVYPCSLPAANVVCVAANDHEADLADFSNYGETSVDLAAPGHGILSTVPPRAKVWADGFERGWTNRWATRTWGLESDKYGNYLSDSPGANYKPSKTTQVRRTAPFDLSGRRGCTLGYLMYLETEAYKDWFVVQASTDRSNWRTVAEWTGSTDDYFYLMEESLADFDEESSVYLRFRLTSNASAQYDGVSIDDVTVRCVGNSYSGDEYDTFDGTSMAAPHVAGAAALLFSAVPGTTVAGVKKALLDGTDTVAWHIGKLSSGGRLDVNRSLDLLLPTIEFKRASAAVDENGGAVTVPVVRRGEAGVPVSVDYQTQDGTATAGDDYEPVSGTLSFPAGATTGELTVPVLDDDVFEGDKTVRLSLANPTGGAVLGVPNVITVTIRDDEPAPQLSFEAPTYTVAEDGGSVPITVVRTGDMDTDVTVRYRTVNSYSADAGADYTKTSGTLSFPAGRTEATFSVPILDDEEHERDETVRLYLDSPTGGAEVVAPRNAYVTITDNDPEPALVEFDRYRLRVHEDVGTVDIRVTRRGNTELPATVDYERTGGTATPDSDLTFEPGTLEFAPGETSKTFSLAITDDQDLEATETAILTLSSTEPSTKVVDSYSWMDLVIEPSDQQPDNWISKRKRSRYVGDDIYNRTGRKQGRFARAKRTQVRNFYVRVYNDGTNANTFRVKGTAPRAGSRVRYLAGSNNVTRAMRSRDGWKIRLRPGRAKLVRVRVKVLRRAELGSRKPFKVRAIWDGDSTRVDTVKAVVKVVR